MTDEESEDISINIDHESSAPTSTNNSSTCVKFKMAPPTKNSSTKISSHVLDVLNIGNQKELDADMSFLLSFLPDIKQMSDIQKIEFKIGMTALIKKIRFPKETTVSIHDCPQNYCEPILKS